MTMHERDDSAQSYYDKYIASALRTDGGHLAIGRGGFILWYAAGARLSSYDCERIRACCTAARLPLIDSRLVPFEEVVRLAVRGPMVAVGENLSPPPYHSLSYAPLVEVASAYRAAAAEVFNIDGPAERMAREEAKPRE
jgi:hypothetical protein